MENPLSTFSIDVDAASYSNMRRFIMNNSLPPKDAVRLEEMINYFTYDYENPGKDHPFSINLETGECPWAEKHRLVHIGLQGRKVETADLPPGNLVFLLDVSGSMTSPNKLGLVKMAIKMLVKNLRKEDRVAMVVYAGAAGLVLPSTSGAEKDKIINALESLQAGGSTAGGAGIKLAYRVARENFNKKGNNRVILATDGDFNVGASSDGEMVRLIEKERESDIFLTVLGFGMGNYKDSKMEKLADKGNGNYAYIDNLLEAKKVLVSEMGGTLLTIAKDVKIQVEFNPAHVQAYRLIGYENRMLKAEDFNDDKKDAGELGAGHTVTALYEIIPVGVKADLPDVDKLKYQKTEEVEVENYGSELLTVKFRYKKPTGKKSRLIVKTLDCDIEENGTDNFGFSAAVAGFGMLLRGSKYKGDLTYDRVLSMAKKAKGQDPNGYRNEFINLVERAQVIEDNQS
jgi:Ca-activated chloride channel family protein